jgi:hypothetical protein
MVLPRHFLHMGALVLTAFVALSCAPRDGVSGLSARGGHVRVDGEQLAGSSSLLAGLAGRVPNMQVIRGSTTCPRVVLRGGRSLTTQGDPLVYVDGTRAGNTCVLDAIPVSQVSRVEIFGSGATPPLGFQSSPYGTIIVFRVTS